MDRSKDWFRQSEFDLATAETLLQNQRFAWACFISHQSAEKALKALLEAKNQPSWGHDLTDLVNSLANFLDIPSSISNVCFRLNLFYIPTRDPDAFPSGAPADKFSQQQAEDALKDAKEVFNFVGTKLT